MHAMMALTGSEKEGSKLWSKMTCGFWHMTEGAEELIVLLDDLYLKVEVWKLLG